MHTYVLRDTEALASRKGSSSTTAVVVFWVFLVVSILFLAAVIIPNVGRLAQDGETVINTEYRIVRGATTSMMVDNLLSTIPNPYNGPDFPCLIGTQNMTKFPDSASQAGSAAKSTDSRGRLYTARDRPGYSLHGHDILADDSPTGTVNYLAEIATTYCYAVTKNGSITQYDTDAKRLNP